MSFWFIQQFSIWYVTRFWRRWVGCGRYCCWSSVSHMSSLDVPHVSSCDFPDVTSPLTLTPRLWWWLFDIDSLLVTLPPHAILASSCNWLLPVIGKSVRAERQKTALQCKWQRWGSNPWPLRFNKVAPPSAALPTALQSYPMKLWSMSTVKPPVVSWHRSTNWQNRIDLLIWWMI